MLRIQLILALFIGWPSFAKDAYTGIQTGVVVQSVTRILPRENADELKAGDLLVLDLDNTTFREAQELGTDDWYSHAEHLLLQSGLTEDQAEAALHPLNVKIKSATEMKLMEDGFPGWIRSLQAKGVVVLGLTARNPELEDVTLRQLRSLGIHFQPGVFNGENMRGLQVPDSDKAQPRYKDGVMFVRQQSKGKVLRAMLDRAGFRPGRVLAIDDRIKHVNSLAEALIELQIDGTVIHYLRSQEIPPFDPQVADFQARYFEATGHLISDEHARRACELLLSGADLERNASQR
jgi:hypothetical protein